MAKPRPSRSKTGRPECSEAVRAWKTTGMVHAIALVLAQCRALARAQGQAALHEAAGVHVAKARALVKHHHEQVTKAHAARVKPSDPKAETKAKAGAAGKARGTATDDAAARKAKAAARKAKAAEAKARAREEVLAKAQARADAERARLDAARARAERARAAPGTHAGRDLAPRLASEAGAEGNVFTRRALALALVREHQSREAITGSFHSMDAPETFHHVLVGGVRYHYTALPDDHERAARHPIVETLSGMALDDPLPPALARHTTDVYLSTRGNKDEAYWAKRYDMPGLQAHATGGERSIVFYHGAFADRPTVAHEMGHVLAEHVYGHTRPRDGSDYRRAMASGEAPVSAYAKVSPDEDFAETAKWYVMQPERLEADHPARHAVFHRLMQEEPGYGG